MWMVVCLIKVQQLICNHRSAQMLLGDASESERHCLALDDRE